MNRNTKRKAKEISKAFAKQRKAGPIIPPASRRRAKWRGAPPLKSRASQVPGFHN